MPIGRFARACRLTVKALRHYAEERVLLPAHVDASTGYRYYTREQVGDAVLIGLLRQLDLGLPAIRVLLQAPPDRRAAVLAREAQRIEREMAHQLARRQQALAAIERFIATGSLEPHPVSIHRVPPLRVAYRSTQTTAEALVADSTTLLRDLFEALQQAGCGFIDPVFCMNDDTGSDDQITVHACVTLTGSAGGWPADAVRDLPGGDFAAVLHRGPYETLGVAYHALYAWAQAHGHETCGLLREVFLNDPAEVSSQDLRTEVLMPIRTADGR
jgi:DNA-binding transcriptional MerR regulator